MTVLTSLKMNALAAIDIGSNGVRFFIARIDRQRLVPLVDQRAAIRLGTEAFTTREISRRTIERLIQSFLDFRMLAAQYQVFHWRAVATSALRDAKNSRQVVYEIWRRTGIMIEVIDGLEEAELLHIAVSRALPLLQKPALLIDMGGGSLEVVTQNQQKIIRAISLRLGTVRMIKRFGADGSYVNYSSVIRRELNPLIQQCDTYKELICPELLIGTGGNLKALARLSARIDGSEIKNCLSLSQIDHLCEVVFSFNFRQRRSVLGLKPDRADVIRPAAAIVRELMLAFNFNNITVPNVGLKNGVVWKLADATRGYSSSKTWDNASLTRAGLSI
jgi:exopolyphosphatase / guanosine-5'-triphosphate,3'-diphosphate pyrophosphatase